jgi:SAM-dependent methyltransferase
MAEFYFRGAARWPPTAARAKKLMAGIAALTRSTVRRLSGDTGLYEIAPGYLAAQSGEYFDDTNLTDEYQKEVYEAAKQVMSVNRLSTVYDIGCGSAYKLMTILGEYDTTGFDLPQTLAFVKERYPDRKWLSASFDDRSLPRSDLVICSDVIEHVDDPDALMRFLVNCAKGWVVISTPDRDLCYSYRWINNSYYGPPRNLCHIREWTMPEFRRYIGRFLGIERHEITNRTQGTQMIVARVR